MASLRETRPQHLVARHASRGRVDGRGSPAARDGGGTVLDARDAATDLFCLEAIVTAPEKPDAAALKRDVAALRKRCRLDALGRVMEEK